MGLRDVARDRLLAEMVEGSVKTEGGKIHVLPNDHLLRFVPPACKSKLPTTTTTTTTVNPLSPPQCK